MAPLRRDTSDDEHVETESGYLSDDLNASEVHSRPPSSRYTPSVMPSEVEDEEGEGDERDQEEEDSVQYESEDIEFPRIFHHIPSDVERHKTQIVIYEKQSKLLGLIREESEILERIRTAREAIRILYDEIHVERATLSKIQSLERVTLTALMFQLVKVFKICPFLLGSINCWWRWVVNTTPELWTAIVFRLHEEKELEGEAKWEYTPSQGVICRTIPQLECAINRSGIPKLRFSFEYPNDKITKTSVTKAGQAMDLLTRSGASLRVEFLDVDRKSAEILDRLQVINARFWSLIELRISGLCKPLAVALTFSSPSPPLNRLIVNSHPYEKKEEIDAQTASVLGYLQPFIHTYFSFTANARGEEARMRESDILTTALNLASTTNYIIFTELVLCRVVLQAEEDSKPFELLHLKRLTLDKCDITWSFNAPNLLYLINRCSTLQDVDNKPLQFDSLLTLTWNQMNPLAGEYICPKIRRLNLVPKDWDDHYISYFQRLARSSTLETLQLTDTHISDSHVMEFLKQCDTIKTLILDESYPTRPFFDALAGCTITILKKNQGKPNPQKMICKSLRILTFDGARFRTSVVEDGCTRIWLPRAHALRKASRYPLQKISFRMHDDEDWTIY